jgi:uncharacterized protein (DUF1697 family)
MVYVALLRGVNVGGNNMMEMRELKAVFEAVGMASVRTFINSGNVIFSSEARDRAELTGPLERGIAGRFGLEVGVLVHDVEEMAAIVDSIPAHWRNDDSHKCDVFFLWPDVDRPSIVDELGSNPEIDEARYVVGAVIRRIDRSNASKSGLLKVVGTPLYRRMTIRNCNTARKLVALMKE